jgi:hypothetical protein
MASMVIEQPDEIGYYLNNLDWWNWPGQSYNQLMGWHEFPAAA